MGSDPIALPMLNALVEEAAEAVEVVGVFTQPDRAVGRGQKIVPNEIKRWAIEQNIRVFQPSKITAEVNEELAELHPDVSLVMAYGHILKEGFMTIPSQGTLNLHTSILPKYRGASPIQSAVVSGDTETGVTLMRIVRELDAGPIADVERVPIERGETAADIESKLAEACVPLLRRNLPALAAGKLVFTEQNHREASFCRKLTKADGVLDFAAPAEILAARINGLHPWPGVRIEMSDHVIRVASAAAEEGHGRIGEVTAIDDQAIVVGTGKGMLRLLRLQRPGGRMMPAGDFVRGFSVELGTTIPSREMPNLIS
ncbi:MAG: methionyl-tRNA formyltransferase [Synoicihabitans sp.]